MTDMTRREWLTGGALLTGSVLLPSQARANPDALLHLSAQLTGFDELDKSLLPLLIRDLRAGHGATLDALIADFGAAVKASPNTLPARAEYLAVAETIIDFWYNGTIKHAEATVEERARAYRAGLVWAALGVNPPGMPAPRNWSDKPGR